MARILPVYILADCSGSMQGEPIASVNLGIRTMHALLSGDSYAARLAHLSLITFAAEAKRITPLMKANDFEPPQLEAGGTTSLGQGLRVLLQSLDELLITSAAERPWNPMVFIFTDGQPTDNWEFYADELKKRRLHVIALACGASVDCQPLKCLTHSVLVMEDVSATAFDSFFRWVSASIISTSTLCSTQPDEAEKGVQLPPPPPSLPEV